MGTWMDDQSVFGALPMRLPTVAFGCLEKRVLGTELDSASPFFAVTAWKQKAHFHLQCLAAILPIIIGFNEYRKELVDLMNAFQTIPHHLFFKTHWMRFTTLIEL